MGGLADALEAACGDLQVEIRREAEVTRVLVDDHRVHGVELADGQTLEAPVVASSVDANWTFQKLISPEFLPAEFRRAVARIDYASASAKINLALAGVPNFTARPSPDVAPHHRGTVHVSPSLDYIERAYDDAKYGEMSREPVLEITMPSSVDETLAPAGKHVMSMFVQFAPYQLAKGKSWDQEKETLADRCIETLARYAPNLPELIEHRQVLSPVDLEETFRLTGGNIMQGAMHLHQLFSMRPVPGWADHRTPIHGLYLCGSASHPGGGVMGACGRNAAAAILRDR
jgi:phytoene dehydrogenase-like protein